MIKIKFPFNKRDGGKWIKGIEGFRYDFYLATKCRFALKITGHKGDEIYFKVSPVIPIEQKLREKGVEYVRGR